jgi:glycosyltransferase involved in cell wall biosynthesis
MAKICMIAYTFYASDPRVRREAEALVARGDTVDFICVRETGKPVQRECNGVNLYPVSATRYRGDSTLAYLLIYATFFIKAFCLVSYLFLRKRYQIVQVHTMPDFLVFAAAIPKLFGAKIILDVHDLMPELYICKFKMQPRHWFIRLLTLMERCSIAFAHRAIAVHTPHQAALVSHGNCADKFSVLLNLPDSRIFNKVAEAPPKDGRFRLIYHGTVAHRHGLEVALRAVALVKDSIPELEFLVIGEGDDLARIKALTAEMSLNGFVRFLGRMGVEELPKYLRQADVGIIPILYDDFTRYMLPLKLMEYVGMEIPSIVSRTETIEAYFDDDMVRFVTPGNVQELGQAILELYGDSQLRRRLVSNAARFNAQYNWEEHRKVYYQLIDSLLPASRRAEKKEIEVLNSKI